jgi:hypothetical protein
VRFIKVCFELTVIGLLHSAANPARQVDIGDANFNAIRDL